MPIVSSRGGKINPQTAPHNGGILPQPLLTVEENACRPSALPIMGLKVKLTHKTKRDKQVAFPSRSCLSTTPP
ncbi:mCG147128 [Mus musculus]|nr:mCG147128 [Mus musculus]